MYTSAPSTEMLPFWMSCVPGPITHNPQEDLPPGVILAWAIAAPSTWFAARPPRMSKTPANGVATERVGTTTRTSVGLGSPLKEMQAVCPAIVANPAGRSGSLHDDHSALVVP